MGFLHRSPDTAGCHAKGFLMVNSARTNSYFCTAVLNATPGPGIFATFKASQVEKKKFKPVTRSKISILFRTLGSEVYHLYSGTQFRGKAVVRSLSSLKAFFFSFFFKNTHCSSATSIRPPLSFLAFPFFFFFGTNYVKHLC